MKLLRIPLLLLPLFVLPLSTIAAHASDILGTADTYAVLGASTVTNTGPSVLWGNLGVAPGTSITGFPPGIVHGVIHDDDAAAIQAQADALAGYMFLAGLAPTQNLTGQDLGGLTLTPGVYKFDSSAQLTGTLTLNFQAMDNVMFVFQIGSTLTTASGSSVVEINPGHNDHVYFQVGSSATLGTTTSFQGDIIALASVTLNHGANINCGSAIALTGAVTLDTNNVNIGNCAGGGGSTPEPGTLSLLATGIVGAGATSALPSFLGLTGGLAAIRKKFRRG